MSERLHDEMIKLQQFKEKSAEKWEKADSYKSGSNEYKALMEEINNDQKKIKEWGKQITLKWLKEKNSSDQNKSDGDVIGRQKIIRKWVPDYDVGIAGAVRGKTFGNDILNQYAGKHERG